MRIFRSIWISWKRAAASASAFLFTFLKGLKDETPFEHVRKLADLWKSEVERYPDRICQIKTYADLMQVQKEGKIGAVMTVEEGGVYEGSIEKLHTLYDLGVRISTLTWNFPNELGFPNPAQEEESHIFRILKMG